MTPGSPERVTVLGAGGFIGSHLVERLEALDLPHESPARSDELGGRNLGAVVYCIGLGADFRRRPLDTVEAHVCLLERILRECRFDSVTYVSSTAMYRGASEGREDDPIALAPTAPYDLYTISKAMGESLVLSASGGGRVARLSTVYGPDFESEGLLPSVLREVASHNEVLFRSSMSSSRDFVGIGDAVDALIKIASTGRHRVYNVASGRLVSNQELATRLVELTGCRVRVSDDAPEVSYPAIRVERLRQEFGFRPSALLDDLPDLLAAYAERSVGGPRSAGA